MFSSKSCDLSNVFGLWNSIGFPIRRDGITTSKHSLLRPSSLFHLLVSLIGTSQHSPPVVILELSAPFCLWTSFYQDVTARVNHSKKIICSHNLIKQIHLLSLFHRYFIENRGPEKLTKLVPSHIAKSCPKPEFKSEWSGRRATQHGNSVSAPAGLSCDSQADHCLLILRSPLTWKDFLTSSLFSS